MSVPLDLIPAPHGASQLTLVEQLGLPLYAQKHVGELEGGD